MMRLDQVSFTGRSAGPHLLITGGVHGDEFEPILAVRELICKFREAPTSMPDAMSHSSRTGVDLACGRLTLVPVVNVEAFERGARTAADGLDLARTCPGRADGMHTEQVAWALSELIRSADYYVDLHSGGTSFAVLPLVGYMLHPDPQVLDRQRNMARAFGLPIVWGTSSELNGRSLSVARDAGVPAIYAEYRGAGNCDPHGVAAYVDGCLNIMARLGMIAARDPVAREQRVVEDSRPASGHLQINNPSPLTGIFLPAVTLGDTVRAGDLLGTVLDVTGVTAHEVRAVQSGILLVLRTFSRVLIGESVGVILERT